MSFELVKLVNFYVFFLRCAWAWEGKRNKCKQTHELWIRQPLLYFPLMIRCGSRCLPWGCWAGCDKIKQEMLVTQILLAIQLVMSDHLCSECHDKIFLPLLLSNSLTSVGQTQDFITSEKGRPGKRMNIDGSEIFFVESFSFCSFYMPGNFQRGNWKEFFF